MAPSGPVSGIAVAIAVAGAIVLYSGLKNATISDTLRALLRSEPVPTSTAGSIGEIRQAVNSSAIGAGTLVQPVPGNIGDGFGAPRPGGRKHKGVDIAAPTGTPIRAAMSGTVTGTGYGLGSGNYVNLSHAGPIQKTKYFHLSAIAVSMGQNVVAGQVIGFVGSTGSSSGPHLHFEVWVNGAAVDPAPYLSGPAAVNV